MKLQNKPLPRLFIDMDGTIAEWRNISLALDSEEESNITIIQERLNEVLYVPDCFYSLKPHDSVIEAVNQIMIEKVAEVFILSCVLPDKDDISPVEQKNRYIDKYLPLIDSNHRIFVPDGNNKQSYVPGGIAENDFLLDDYTKNLIQWEELQLDTLKSGIGIKLLNNVNSSKNTWYGSQISYEESPEEIVNSLSLIINKGVTIIHPQPAKDFSKISAEEFLDDMKDK